MLTKNKATITWIGLILAISLLSIIIILLTGNTTKPITKTVPAPTTTSSKSIDELNTEAKMWFDQGDYAQAIAIYEQIMDRQPNDVGPILDLAHTYRYWGRHKESEQFFLKALEIDDTDAWVYTDLGKLYRNMNQYEKAEATFKKSLSLDPNMSYTYSYGLGYLYLDQDRYSEAEEMFLKALEIDPDSEMATAGLGDLYREMRRYDESEAMFKKVFTINPNSESWYGLCWLYLYQERYADAVVACQNYLTKIREKAEVYNALAIAYKEQGDIPNAITSFSRAAELNPTNTNYINSLNQLIDN